MPESIASYFSHNGQMKPVKEFNDEFLQKPHYIYEVFRVIDGVALFLEDHLERLKQTCALSEHCQGFTASEVVKHVYEVIQRNQLKVGNMKMVLYKDSNAENHFLIYITPHEYPTDDQFREGIPVAFFRGIRNNPNAKVMDIALRTATNLMKQQKEVYETLLVDQNGCITEGSRSNVFFARQGAIITPPLKDVLPGITRKYILDICKKLGIEAREEQVVARSVVIMEAAFISGTSRKVLPVKSIDALEFDANHPLVRKIAAAFDEHTKNYITNKLLKT